MSEPAKGSRTLAVNLAVKSLLGADVVVGQGK